MTYILSQTEDGTICPDDLELFIGNQYIEFRAKRVLIAEQQKLADCYLKKKGILPEGGDISLEEAPKKTPEDQPSTSDCGADFEEGVPFDAFKLLEPLKEKILGSIKEVKTATGTSSSSSSTTIKVKSEGANMLE